MDQIAYPAASMRRQGETSLLLFINTPTDEKHPPTHLRDTILSGEQFSALDYVPSVRKRVSDFAENGPLAKGCEARDIFNDDTSRLEFCRQPQKLSEQSIARVPDFALANDAEALTGRATDEQIQLSRLKPSDLKDFG